MQLSGKHVIGIDFLSESEHDSIKDFIPFVKEDWFVKSDESLLPLKIVHSYSRRNEVICMYGDASGVYLRPVLILDPIYSKIEIGEKYSLFGIFFTGIGVHKILCDSCIKHMPLPFPVLGLSESSYMDYCYYELAQCLDLWRKPWQSRRWWFLNDYYKFEKDRIVDLISGIDLLSVEEYSIARSRSIPNNVHGWWWLRDKVDEKRVRTIDPAGEIDQRGCNHDDCNGLRPALVLSKDIDESNLSLFGVDWTKIMPGVLLADSIISYNIFSIDDSTYENSDIQNTLRKWLKEKKDIYIQETYREYRIRQECRKIFSKVPSKKVVWTDFDELEDI